MFIIIVYLFLIFILFIYFLSLKFYMALALHKSRQ
nr:MAG TPA: hypothetical protein [Caudoviricetes sp.]